jgi:hypothetical protein
VEFTPGSDRILSRVPKFWGRVRDTRHVTEYDSVLATSIGLGKPADENVEFTVAVPVRSLCDSSSVGLGRHRRERVSLWFSSARDRVVAVVSDISVRAQVGSIAF